MRKDKPAYLRWRLNGGKLIEFSNRDTFSKYFALKVTSAGTFFLNVYPKFTRFYSWATTLSLALTSNNGQTFCLQLIHHFFSSSSSFFKKTLHWANIKNWGRGSGQGQFHTNHCILSTRASSWCLCLQECGKGLWAEIKHIWPNI